jgi:hypothetical protein
MESDPFGRNRSYLHKTPPPPPAPGRRPPPESEATAVETKLRTKKAFWGENGRKEPKKSDKSTLFRQTSENITYKK